MYCKRNGCLVALSKASIRTPPIERRPQCSTSDVASETSTRSISSLDRTRYHLDILGIY